MTGRATADEPRGLLIGYGSVGRRHLANLSGLGVDDWAVVHTGQGTLPYEPPRTARTYARLEEALDDGVPTFAVIANPTALHVESAVACAERGCDLLLEKPVSNTPDGIDALCRAVAGHHVGVLVGFQFRFHPGLLRVVELLRDDAIGDPLHIGITWGEHLPAWHPWEDWREGYAARRDLGGGVHHTLCHPFDYLSMIVGDVTELVATTTTDGPLGLSVAEAADVLLRFDRGVTAQVHLDYWARPATHRMEVVCTRGTIELDLLLGQLRWASERSEWRVEAVPGVGARDELFVAEARHFLDVVARRASPTCTLDDGIRTLRVCAAIERSAELGETIELEPA